MNAKNISLTLAALAVMSTSAAFANDVIVKPIGTVINTGRTVVLTPVKMTKTFVHGVFHPTTPLFDLSVLGMGVSVGGDRTIVEPAVSSSEVRVLTNAAVIPGSIRQAVPVSMNEEAPGRVLDLGLFGFGIHAGRVPKALDMR